MRHSGAADDLEAGDDQTEELTGKEKVFQVGHFAGQRRVTIDHRLGKATPQWIENLKESGHRVQE